jgi:hypothetical protein
MEDGLKKMKNGRRPKKMKKMEDDLKKRETTLKKMEDDLKNKKMESDLIFFEN